MSFFSTPHTAAPERARLNQVSLVLIRDPKPPRLHFSQEVMSFYSRQDMPPPLSSIQIPDPPIGIKESFFVSLFL